VPHVEIDPQRCTGCRICEQVCTFGHEGLFGPARSRLRVLRRDVLTFQIQVCSHCDEAHCVVACPAEALFRQGSRTVFEPELCLGCEACVEVCTLLFWDEERQQPLLCDLCGACVSRCPEEAIAIAGE
jgi:anaerobic carbon-monoxide dehydrogenase iron sulfur subunit